MQYALKYLLIFYRAFSVNYYDFIATYIINKKLSPWNFLTAQSFKEFNGSNRAPNVGARLKG